MKQNMKTVFVLMAIGITAGIIGIILTLLMHNIQDWAFGNGFYGDASFRELIEGVSPLHRFVVLLGAGGMAGIGWVCIHRYGTPLVDIKTTINNPEKSMPIWTTLGHNMLQIITIALGSPLGKERAPREISVVFADQLTRLFHINHDIYKRKVLLACASGAGLAAVYNTPLASSLFIIETLLADWNVNAVGSALICCSTAVYIMRLGVGDLIQYPLPQVPFNETLIMWAVAAAPVIALFAYWFDKSTVWCHPLFSRKSPKMIGLAVIGFGAIGILSMYFPEILGNGQAGNELSFTFSIGWKEGAFLFGTKWIAVLLALGAGAYGGNITPSMMLGSMLALVTALIWNGVLPEIPVAAAAFIGAAVFLGLTQKMPVTAAVFLLELTRFSPAYLFPICGCFAVALPLFHYLKEHIFF